MYIEKRKYYEGVRYWLSHSFREGRKIHKIRKLLGTDLSSKILEERRKKAEQLILEEVSKYKIIKDPITNKISEEDYRENQILKLSTYQKLNGKSSQRYLAITLMRLKVAN